MRLRAPPAGGRGFHAGRAALKIDPERERLTALHPAAHIPNEDFVFERFDENVEAAAAGQLDVEIGRALAAPQKAGLAGVDGLHGFKCYGLLQHPPEM